MARVMGSRTAGRVATITPLDRLHGARTSARYAGWKWRRHARSVWVGIDVWCVVALVHVLGTTVRTVVTAALATGILGMLAAKAVGDANRPAGRWVAYFCWPALWAIAFVWAAPWSPLGLLLAVLVCLGCSVSWWRHLRVRPDETPAVTDRQDAWVTFLGQGGTALPGSLLIEDRPTEHGWAGTVVMPQGSGGGPLVAKAIEKIATTFDVTSDSVIVEPHPETHRRALVTILERNPLHQPLAWAGPTLDRKAGTCRIGRYHDGEAALWRFWDPGSGAKHGIIAGTTGSGKSSITNLLLAEARHSGLIVPWLADPKMGQSLPDWVDAVGRFAATPDQIAAMLTDAVTVMHARMDYLANVIYRDSQGRKRRGLSSFEPLDPRHGDNPMPLVVMFLDEAPRVMASKGNAKAVAEIATQGRSLGIAVILLAQVPLVKTLGGESEALSQVLGGSKAVFRTARRLEGDAIFQSGLSVDPASIPARTKAGKTTAGIGYTGDRAAPFRGDFVADPYTWATTGTPALLDAVSAAALDEQAPGQIVPDEMPRAVAARPRPATSGRRTARTAVLDALREAPAGMSRRQLQDEVTGWTDRNLRLTIAQLLAEDLLREDGDTLTLTRQES